jgi:class 3 adenylate cyclase/cold shock CspA family protein
MNYGPSSHQQDDQSSISAFKIPDLGDVFQTPSAKVQRTALYIDEVNSSETKAKVPEAQWVNTAAYIYTTINRMINEIDTPNEILVKWLGDGALITFDAADATKAINAAIRIQYAIKRANEERAIESFCSIGIATGGVFAFTTPQGTHDHLGTVMDRGARLCSAANASAIFIDHDTAAAANTTLIESPLGVELGRTARDYLGGAERVEVKGFEQPPEYFEILWDKQRFSVKNKVETARTSRVEHPVMNLTQTSAPPISTGARLGFQERRQGEIKVWIEEKSCGFIRDPKSGEEFYFRAAMLVDPDDMESMKTPGTRVAFVAKEAAAQQKCRQASAIMLVDEYYEGDLVIPPNKSNGWIVVDDQQSNRQHIYLRDTSTFRNNDPLSFKLAVGDRGVYADDVAQTTGQDAAA